MSGDRPDVVEDRGKGGGTLVGAELRHHRGADRVAQAGIDPSSSSTVLCGARALAARHLALPPLTVEVATARSRTRPAARGRYLAGVVTLFPPAFADPFTLAWTVLHELAHAAGRGEDEADAFARALLAEPSLAAIPPVG